MSMKSLLFLLIAGFFFGLSGVFEDFNAFQTMIFFFALSLFITACTED